MAALFLAFFIGLLAIAGLYYLFSLYAAWQFFRSRPPVPDTLPAVSILKPLKGADPDLYENLASFCRLDYPTFQILFGIRDPQDPAVAVAQQLRRDFPECDIVLMTNPEIIGTNYKVSTLHHLTHQAKYDTLVITDSDVWVDRHYLQKLIPWLAPPDVGLVTCLYRGGAVRTLAAVIESLIINTIFVPLVLVANKVESITYAFGATIAVKRHCLDRIGGFAALADYLADDYYLGFLVTQAGYRIQLVPHVVETKLETTRFRDLFVHQLRWARTQHNCRPGGYRGTFVTYGTISAVFSWVAFRSSPLIQLLALGVLSLRFLSAVIIGGAFLKTSLTLRSLWIVPLADVISFVVWCASLRGDTVQWGEHTFRIGHDGKMIRLNQDGNPLL